MARATGLQLAFCFLGALNHAPVFQVGFTRAVPAFVICAASTYRIAVAGLFQPNLSINRSDGVPLRASKVAS